MADETTGESVPMLVLASEGGDTFAIPMEALEQYKVPEEHKHTVAAESGDEVAGFGSFGWSTPHVVDQTPAWILPGMSSPSSPPRGFGSPTAGLRPR
jgi:hypothetical protein